MSRHRVAPVLLLGATVAAVAAAQEGTPEASGAAAEIAVGKQIYQTGTSPSGEEIVAVMAGGTELPAAALPCSSCHGEDGRGNPEGGVNPSDLTWSSLTRPYGVSHPGGREHPPYTERLLKRAIALGVDPAGNELHVGMPRYQMSLEDMEALVAYIRQLGRDRDPGVGEGTLRLGTLLPPPGPMGSVGGVIRAVLDAWAVEVNEGGGFYGREVEIATFELPAAVEERPEAVAGFLEREGVFALVGAFLAGSEDRIPALLEERKVPLLGPFTLHPKLEEPVNPYVFYLLPGLPAQGRAMVRFAHGRSREAGTGEEPPRATVLYPEGNPELAATSGAMIREAAALGWERVEERTYRPGALDALGLASTLATVNSQVLFFLGSGADRNLLLQAGDAFDWRPEVYTPGTMAGPEALATPPAFDGRFFLTFPTLPDDRTAGAAEAYHRLAAAHELPAGHLAVQLSTLAAARLFEEGAKRAGRDLSRSKLVAELEELYKWDSGLTPPLTFTPNRRVGAQGAYVVAFDREGRTFRRVGGWVAVD